MAKIPKEIQVGPFTYRVKVSTKAIDAACRRMGKHLMGCCSSELLLISVSPDLPHDQTVDTLLHEVLHACVQVAGSPLEKMDHEEAEENAIGVMTSTLLGVLRSNPALVDYLTA